MKVYEKIRFMREERNWSQEEMAAKLNMSVNGYSKIERGESRVHIPKLEQIAEILEMDVIELMSLGEKSVYFSANDNGNNGYNIIGSTELALELQKQQLIIELKDKELAMQQRENENLKVQILQLQEINGLLKQSHS
jgi:transcriptional regulator with XRE-family HTH domain